MKSYCICYVDVMTCMKTHQTLEMHQAYGKCMFIKSVAKDALNMALEFSLEILQTPSIGMSSLGLLANWFEFS